MISVVCWLWTGEGRDFAPAHVNVLRRMIARNLAVPHRFICVADSPAGFESGVEVVITPPAAIEVGKHRNPEGPRFPSCYRRLWTFSADAEGILGERILCIDIDLVVVADLTPALSRQEDFVGWRPKMIWGTNNRIGGGMFLLRAGARREVWERFNGQESILEARRARYRGSDQAWLSYCLAGTAATWDHTAGLYSIRDLREGVLPLPDDARLVQFNGPRKPWTSELPWVRDHWR